jgi:hypothetical protein
VFGGLNRLVVASLVAGVFFVAPSAALACGGGPSAKNVYSECLPSAGSHGGTGADSHGGIRTGGQSGGPGSAPISSKTAKAIKQAGKNSRALAAFLRRSAPTALESSSQESAPPSAVGSAFDLGSGPTALLLALAGTAVLLLAASGVRGWRRSHRA